MMMICMVGFLGWAVKLAKGACVSGASGDTDTPREEQE